MSGTGVPVSCNEMLFLRALRSGRTGPENLARLPWDGFYPREAASIPESTWNAPGRGVESDERGAYCPGSGKTRRADGRGEAFAAKRLPVLRALGAA